MRIGIDDADNRAIGRRVFSFERKARFFAAAPENQFANARAQPNRPPPSACPTAARSLFKSLHDQQLASFKRFVLDGCDDSSDDASELHLVQCSSLAVSRSCQAFAIVQSELETLN